MKLTNVTITAPKLGARFGQNELRDAREKRMKAFWAASENAIIHPVGKLLATKVSETETIADILVQPNGEVELDELNVDGKVLPLLPGFRLSLANLVSVWSCPACRSAHGSGVYPSREVSAKLLMGNKFYYRPSDKALFSISDTCWGDYVHALGAAKPSRFISPSSMPIPALATGIVEGPAIPPAKPTPAPKPSGK